MHPSQERLIGFLHGSLPEDVAEGVFQHLDTCEPCRERFQALQLLQEDFDGQWDEFVAELAAREQLGQLGQPGMRQALLRIQSVLDGARRLATWASGGGLSSAGPLSLDAAFKPAYGGVGDPGDPVVQWQHKAATQVDQNDPEAALQSLEKLAAAQPDTAASSEIELQMVGQVVGRAVIDARRRSVAVMLQNDFITAHAVTVRVQVDVQSPDGDTTSHAATAQPVVGAPYHLAELENLPDGVVELRVQLQESGGTGGQGPD